LSKLGYQVTEAENAQSALRILDGGAHFDLLFTDIVMPGGMSGIDLVKEAVARHPSLKVLMTSGFPGAAVTRNNGFPRGIQLIGKPFGRDDLAKKIRETLRT
jgi:DNA-binding NtrC family response regulator